MIYTRAEVTHGLTLAAVVRETKKVRMDAATLHPITYAVDGDKFVFNLPFKGVDYLLGMSVLEVGACLNAGGHYNATTCQHPFYFLSFKVVE